MKNVFPWIRLRWNWKVYGVLMSLYTLGFATGFPFVLSFEEYKSPHVFWDELLNGFLLGAAVLSMGMALSKRTGLGMTVLDNWISGKPKIISPTLVLSLSVMGVIVSSFLLLALRFVASLFIVAMGGDISTTVQASADLMSNYPEIWKWFLVAFHASVTEEIIFRFGLMNLLVWTIQGLGSENKGLSPKSVFWISNLIAGFIFGLLHLIGVVPVPDDLLSKTLVVLQNMWVGLLFGWFYWKFGLESAMLTHFLLDVFLYVWMIPLLMTADFVLILAGFVITVIALIVAINKYSAISTKRTV